MNLVIALALATQQPVFEVSCESPTGQAYYVDQPSPKWSADAMTIGKITIQMYADESVKVQISDSAGRVFDPVDHGATVTKLLPSGLLSILATYNDKRTHELYAVYGNEGRYTLLWTVIRDGRASIAPTKVAAYTADCTIN